MKRMTLPPFNLYVTGYEVLLAARVTMRGWWSEDGHNNTKRMALLCPMISLAFCKNDTTPALSMAYKVLLAVRVMMRGWRCEGDDRRMSTIVRWQWIWCSSTVWSIMRMALPLFNDSCLSEAAISCSTLRSFLCVWQQTIALPADSQTMHCIRSCDRARTDTMR